MNPQKYFKYIKKQLKQLVLDAKSPRMVPITASNNEKFFQLFDLRDVSACLKKNDIAGAINAVIRHYEHRTKYNWPKPPDTITDLRLNIEEIEHKEIIEKANNALKLKFSPDGTLPNINNDGKIIWNSNPHTSPEWIWRLNRHQWWIILGIAYKITGDERYTKAFVEQMNDWVINNPPPVRKDESSACWRLMETGMRMTVSWIPAFGLFYESAKFKNQDKLLMLRSIYEHAKFISLFCTNRNHLLRESNGLAYISTYFPEFKESKQWKEIALSRIKNELDKQINEDGFHIELSTGYQLLVSDELEKTYALLERDDKCISKIELRKLLEKMYHALAYIIRPDFTFPEINDGFIRWNYKRLKEAGEKFSRPDFIYIGSKGIKGSTPKETSAEFDDAGLFVMRSDWTKQAKYLLFDAGPYGGPHGHEDKLSIEVFAFGKPFIVDSGSYTYEKKDPFRKYFVGSQGHNTVLVDGKSQIRRWYNENLNPKKASGNYASWISSAEFDYVSAYYKNGYGFFSLKKPNNTRILKDVQHFRRVLFVKPDYWIIVDEIIAKKHHDYQILFHCHPDISVDIEANHKVTLKSAKNRSFLYLLPADSSIVDCKTIKGSESPIQGWYSVEHHQKTPSNTIIFEQIKAKSTVLTTLVYPSGKDQYDNEVKIETIDLHSGKGLGYIVHTHRGRDYLMFSNNNSFKIYGNYKSKGKVAVFRTNKDKDIVTQFEGHTL